MTVNDDGPADNVICGEALVIEGKPGITFVSKKGKQVACVVRMRFAGRIVVVPCFGEVNHRSGGCAWHKSLWSRVPVCWAD